MWQKWEERHGTTGMLHLCLQLLVLSAVQGRGNRCTESCAALLLGSSSLMSSTVHSQILFRTDEDLSLPTNKKIHLPMTRLYSCHVLLYNSFVIVSKARVETKVILLPNSLDAIAIFQVHPARSSIQEAHELCNTFPRQQTPALGVDSLLQHSATAIR